MSMSITSFLNSAMYIKNLKFPVKLHKMLCDPSLSDIMIWTPCGQAWKILDGGELFEEVAPLKYRNFLRKVSYWGFTKIKSGKNKDCYFNKFFQRDSPHLLSEMKTRNNTPKQEAGKQVVVQNNVSSPDGVSTQTANNGHAFSSSANLKRNPCNMRNSIPNVLNHASAAPVIYEQKKESNEGTGKDENKASTYQKWCKQSYSRHVNQEHVDEKLDVVKPSGSEKEREMKEKETHQQEEQKQKTQIAMTPAFIYSPNSGTFSPSSNSDTRTIYQLFKELQEQRQKKEEEQETQKAHTSTSSSNESVQDKISEDGNHREKASEGSIKKSRKRKQFSKDEATKTPKKKNKRGRPKGWKKDEDHPKKALTAYNLFFRDERKRVLSSIEVSNDIKNTQLRKRKGRSDPHGKISFSELGKIIGQNWRNASEETRGKYNEMALVEKMAYEKTLEEYRRKKEVETVAFENGLKTIL